jgi:trk system potassium uptake protein TrkH
MNILKNNKLPLLFELILSGLFIFLYTLLETKDVNQFISGLNFLDDVIVKYVYLIPFVILITTIWNYCFCKDYDEFNRKYIFSVIIIVPMFLVLGDVEFTFWLAAVHLFSSVLSIYEGDENRLKNKNLNKINIGIIQKIKLKPAQIVMVSFLGIIAVGAILLSLPISAAEGKSISLVDAIFMATSATCVTGLATISLADNFSMIGQIIILALIQVGGLGFMTLSSSMAILLGKSLAVKDQVVMQGLLDISSFEDLLSMVIDIVKFTLVIEFVGAIILTIAFSWDGYEVGQALYYGFFHSISAFCNAGFALFNNSLENFPTDPFIQGVIAVLVILGGLGFIVMKEVRGVVLEKKKLMNLSLHSKIVLVTNFSLLAFGTLYIFFSEYLHSLDGYSFFDQLQISFFQSVTTRTAGFNTMPLGNFHLHTIYFMALLMFIGASPGSTGGGIKVTTFAILFQSVRATLKGKSRVDFFDRTIPENIVVRSIAIIVISLILVSFFILLLLRIETEQSFLDLFFEAVSAFSTVGLSLGITPSLTVWGKFTLVAMMFIGRVGPLTIALAIGEKQHSTGNVDYPEGRVIIG